MFFLEAVVMYRSNLNCRDVRSRGCLFYNAMEGSVQSEISKRMDHIQNTSAQYEGTSPADMKVCTIFRTTPETAQRVEEGSILKILAGTKYHLVKNL